MRHCDGSIKCVGCAVRTTVHGMHTNYNRCRTVSKRQIAVAAAAFSDSALPGIGMDISRALERVGVEAIVEIGKLDGHWDEDYLSTRRNVELLKPSVK